QPSWRGRVHHPPPVAPWTVAFALLQLVEAILLRVVRDCQAEFFEQLQLRGIGSRPRADFAVPRRLLQTSSPGVQSIIRGRDRARQALPPQRSVSVNPDAAGGSVH